MALLLSGAVVFLVTAGVFWALLPRGGRTHRWAGTAWEPYVSVGICAGVALSFTMMLSGVLALAGSS